MLVLRKSNFKEATIRPIVPRHKHSIVFIVQKKFKNHLNYFQLFKMTAVKKKENRHNTFSIVYSLQTHLFTEKFSRTSIIHPGIFRGRAQWADSLTTISRHVIKSKPIRIGEDLVVNRVI